MAAVYAMHSGIPSSEIPFWNAFFVEQLYDVYLSLNATPAKVLSLIDEPYVENASQARIFEYLQQYIGDLKSDELQQFIRFTTGSSVIIAEHIKVSFNALTGLARRPIAHTCDCLLELPSTYQSFLEFRLEFSTILADKEFSWDMLAL